MNIMRGFYIVFLFLLTQSICAQLDITINSPFLVSSAGNTWSQDNYILCFSLGELVIETKAQQNTILTQGFHQENHYQITNLEDELNHYQINIYPNPTSDILNVYCSESFKANIEIKDARGCTVFSNEAQMNNNYSIDMSHFASGVYFLEILLPTSNKQVYQIQKFN